jgi:hypothetical protein
MASVDDEAVDFQTLGIRVDVLTKQVATLTETLAKAQKPKDFWDKLSLLSTLMSGAILGFLGFIATSHYNSGQIKISSIKTVEKFFPHLSSSDQRVSGAAIESIAAIDPNLALQLAQEFENKDALYWFAQNPQLRTEANMALSLINGWEPAKNIIDRISKLSPGRALALAKQMEMHLGERDANT